MMPCVSVNGMIRLKRNLRFKAVPNPNFSGPESKLQKSYMEINSTNSRYMAHIRCRDNMIFPHKF